MKQTKLDYWIVTCVSQMLLSLSPEERSKRVHVVTDNTLFETPMMIQHVAKSLKAIENASAAQNLPIVVHTAVPEMTGIP
ncbi:hypothetical protein VN24_22635 [Paenibacillus beijingensis]|uniref:Uncharacterized protein n=1 Tax=Paenibacillus beijingensis TaxID=1126833 RepID=A0A0D5NNG0_9BACL|nr:hypothetical protein VN24_22635 [Paenibacillus beijingensis]